jgi:hypothetical protein
MQTLLGVLGKVPRPTPAMAVALLALIIACSGAAVAAIPGSGGTITACRDNKDGELRAIDAEGGQRCGSKETQLTWKDGITGKVADSEKLDGLDSTAFALANHQHSTEIKEFGGGIPVHFIAEADRWKMVGSPATVNVTSSSQRITASGAAPIGWTVNPGDVVPLGYGICYDTPAGGDPITFAFDGDYYTADLTPARTPLAASEAQSGFSPGTYYVGFCVKSEIIDMVPLNDSGVVRGWVMVTND